MALTTCTECGKRFSDQSPACPNCGCPTEVILESVKKQLEEERAKVIMEYNILGKQFPVTEALDKSLMLSKVLADSGRVISKDAEQIYKGKGSIDRVIEEIPVEMAESLDQLVGEAVELLKSSGVYEFDKERFYAKYEQALDTSGLLRPIIEQYLRILDLEDKINTYHDYIAQSRKNTWQGGGFGVSGAIKGHIQAQMLNYGTAFLHSIPDSSRRAQDQEKIDRLKADLYRDPGTLAAVVDGYQHILNQVMTAVFNELEHAGVLAMPERDPGLANSLTNNVLDTANLSRDQEINICRQAFWADPLNADVIETILLLDLDDSGDVAEYAKRYGFYDGYLVCRQIYLREVYAEEIAEIKSYENDYSNEAFCKIIENCITMAEDGLQVDTYVTDAVKRRIRHELTQDDVLTLTTSLRMAGKVLGKEFVTDGVKQIHEAKHRQDMDARTVNGVTYGTQAELSKAKEEVGRITTLCGENSEIEGFSALMDLDAAGEIKTEAGKKEYEKREKMLLELYKTEWRIKSMDVVGELFCAGLAYVLGRWGLWLFGRYGLIGKLVGIVLLGVTAAIVLFFVNVITEIVTNAKKRKEFERRFNIKGNRIVKNK